MKIFDISMNIHPDMAVYNNSEEKKPNISVQKDFTTGKYYESVLEMNLHTGTHLDAPLHMIEKGDTLDNLDLSKVITKCKVIDLTHLEERISANDLNNREIKREDFIIFKTKNSFTEGFDKNFVYLDTSGAQYLKNAGIKGVGIDSLGIERSQPDHSTHITLLSSGIVILEGLRLADVPEGEYLLFAAPIKINGVEAAPVRAVLVSEL